MKMQPSLADLGLDEDYQPAISESEQPPIVANVVPTERNTKPTPAVKSEPSSPLRVVGLLAIAYVCLAAVCFAVGGIVEVLILTILFGVVVTPIGVVVGIPWYVAWNVRRTKGD